MLKHQIVIVFIGLGLFGLSFAKPSKAQKNVQEFDNYVIHYNALPTDFLSTQVAKQHKITRSRNRILLNVTVKQKQPGQRKQLPVKAKITVLATNRTGQIKKTTMRPIQEGSSIYYIGEFNVANRETLKFKVQVTPVAQKKTYTVKFDKQFFTR